MCSATCSWHHVTALLGWSLVEKEHTGALGSGLLEDPLACLSGREERTHFISLYLGWGDPQPSKGTPYILSGKTRVLFQPLVCPLCEWGILCNSRQLHFV